jgi:phenylacetate-CoA ligase
MWDRFTDVEGHWNHEMITGKSGARISLTALNMHGPIFDRVVRYQYHQETVGKCTLRLVVAPGFSETDSRAIQSAYLDKVGDEVEFVVKVVQDIPLTERGKLKLLDSSLIEKADS